MVPDMKDKIFPKSALHSCLNMDIYPYLYSHFLNDERNSVTKARQKLIYLTAENTAKIVINVL
jgi:hypothetical protein